MKKTITLSFTVFIGSLYLSFITGRASVKLTHKCKIETVKPKQDNVRSNSMRLEHHNYQSHKHSH